MPLRKALVRIALLAPFASPALAGLPDPATYKFADSESGNYLSALIASADRDSGAAALYFGEALRADPHNLDLVERAFAAALASGDTKGAFGLADRIVTP